MQVQALKSRLVRPHDDLLEVIKEAVTQNRGGQLTEGSVLVIASKIVAYCQGRVIAKTTTDENKEEKHQLVSQEAEEYLPAAYSQYDMMLAIKEHTLTVNAGIDESNAVFFDEQGQPQAAFVLWPVEMQTVVNQVWQFLRQEYGLQKVGVILTDSRSNPLRWGVVGTALAGCGFKPLNREIGKKDLFGREIRMVNVNVMEALAVAGTLVMGEVAEQSPFAIISECPMVQFLDHSPTPAELQELWIERADDIFGPLLTSQTWLKGKGGLQVTAKTQKGEKECK